MRVLWLTPGFAADEQDHNCIPPQQLLARGLLARGVDLHIIALEYPFRSDPYRWHGARVYPCDGRNRRWLKWHTWRMAAQLSRTVIREKPVDALHSFWLGRAAEIGEKVAAGSGIPHFTTLMGQDVLPGNLRFLRALTAERAGRLIAVSEYQNTELEKSTGFRAGRVIPWGIEPLPPAVTPTVSRPPVLGVGSLVPVKNWEKWLRVLALTAPHFPGLQAELIGDGPERKKLEGLARQLGLSETVRLAGSLPRARVLEKMRQSGVLLHTADFESFGYVLAEAAASDCRVVSTPVGIAEQAGKTADTEQGLADLLLEALRGERQAPPFAPLTLEETAEAYMNLYQGARGWKDSLNS